MQKLLHSELFKRYIVTYFVVIIVIISLIGLTLNSQISKTIEKEVSDVNLKRLIYINSIIEKSVLEPAEKIVLDNIMSTQLSNISSPYTHWELHRFLKEQIKIMPFVESLNVYYPSQKMLISSNAIKYDLENFGDYQMVIRHNEVNSNLQNWMNEENGVINYARSSVAFDISVNIYGDYIKNILMTQQVNENESIIIFNEHYEVVSKFGADKLNNINFSKFLDGTSNPLSIKNINGKNMMVLSYYSSYNHWHYALIIPPGDFFRVSTYIKNTILIVSVTVMIFGLLSSIIVSLRQYKPVKKIMSDLYFEGNRSNHKNNCEPKNEYAFIQEHIFQLYRSVDELKSKVSESNLNKLLEGIIDGPNDKELQNYMKGDQFIVIAFKIQDSKTVAFEKVKDYLNNPNSDEKYQAFITAYSKNIMMAVLNFSGEANRIYDHISEVTIAIKEKLCISFFCGAGSVVNELTDLHISCENAKRALKYHFIKKNKNPLIYYRDVQHLEDFSMVSVQHSAWVQAFDNNNMKEVQQLFIQISTMLLNKVYRYESVEYVIHQIIPIVSKKMMETDLNMGQQILNYKNLSVEFFMKSDIFDALQWLEQIVQNILSMKTEENSTHTLMQGVKTYIDQHYEHEISLELLSQKTFISASYISLLFKRSFGIGLSDYVSRLRLEKAKRLLENEHLKIEEISDLVGMSNSTYFITKFRKKYGLTPNQYRLQFKAKHLF